MELTGKKYPIKSAETDQIVGYKTIKSWTDLSNVAGVVVSLTENDSPNIFVSYVEASRIDNNTLDIPDVCFDK
jgi:hypothetical protein